MGDHELNRGLMNSLQHQENQNNFHYVFTVCTQIVQHYYCLHANCEVCVRVIEGWPAHCGNRSFIHTRSNRSFGEEGRKRAGRLMGWEVAFSGKDGNEKRTPSLSHNKTLPSPNKCTQCPSPTMRALQRGTTNSASLTSYGRHYPPSAFAWLLLSPATSNVFGNVLLWEGSCLCLPLILNPFRGSLRLLLCGWLYSNHRITLNQLGLSLNSMWCSKFSQTIGICSLFM